MGYLLARLECIVFAPIQIISIHWPAVWVVIVILVTNRVSGCLQSSSAILVADITIEALAFNQQVCKSSNVTIPDSIGCSPPTSSTTKANILVASSTVSSVNMSATIGVSSTSKLIGLTTATATGNYFVPAVTLPSNAPVAKFTGGLLLQGSCTIPQFASVTIDGGGTLEYPWLGCSNLDPSCCPFDISVGGLLSVCPSDYFTTSGACCPS